MANFGASFKKARESKGISLGQIANETRISTRFLQAIENEDFQSAAWRNFQSRVYSDLRGTPWARSRSEQ